LRFDGKNEVYVTKGNIAHLFNEEENYYRSRNLLTFNKDNINKIDLAYIDDADSSQKSFLLTFQAAGGVWKIEKPEAADGDISKINQFLAKISGLEVGGWYDADSAANPEFDTPNISVTLARADGSEIRLIVGSKNSSGKRYSKVENNDTKYLLEEWKISFLRKKWEDLKAPEKKADDSVKAPVAPIKGLPGTGN